MYTGGKNYTLVRNYIPWCKTLYLGANIHTQVQNFTARYKFHTWVKNLGTSRVHI
jgi:hypothetical protein